MLSWGEIRELLYWLAWAGLGVYGALTLPVLFIWFVAAWQSRAAHPEIFSWQAVTGSVWWILTTPCEAWKSLLGKEERG